MDFQQVSTFFDMYCKENVLAKNNSWKYITLSFKTSESFKKQEKISPQILNLKYRKKQFQNAN